MFDLRVRAGFARLAAESWMRMPELGLLNRMRDYVEAMLLAEGLQPSVVNIAMLVKNFAKLIQVSREGKPFIYQKRHTISLLFDVFAVQS